MITVIVNLLLGLAERILSFQAKKADSDTERARIEAGKQAASEVQAAGVVKEGMQHKLFWIPWLLAAVPTAAWYGWGILDSMIYAGAVLPDVAALPPQLKTYADLVWANIFYAGAGVTIAQILRGR